MPLIAEDLLQVRTPGVCFYVLRDAGGLYLIDGGFIRGPHYLSRALVKHGWDKEPIKGIIITHGHLDHVLNVAAFARESGAWIAAPRLDALHYEGRYPYHGSARVCGFFEACGRSILGYSPFHVDQWLDDLTEIPVWHGLVAVHLPGHTDGHMGFLCPRRRLLFSADLFASYAWLTHLPPAILNSHPEQIASSVSRAVSLDFDGVLPNHCDQASPEEHLRRLRKLAQSQA